MSTADIGLKALGTSVMEFKSYDSFRVNASKDENKRLTVANQAKESNETAK